MIHFETFETIIANADKEAMSARKHVPTHISKPVATKPRVASNPNLDDYAQEVLWLTIALQALFLAGTYWKIPIFTSAPIFYFQFLAPAATVVVASTWRRAMKYSFLSSLVIPGGVSLILVLVVALQFLIGLKTGNFPHSTGLIFKTSFTAWVIILAATLPSIAVGAIIRFVWSYVRPKS